MKILEDFVVNRKAKHERSKLYAQKEQIFELARRNYSSYAIVEFLALVGVETTRKNVDNFLKRHKNKINKQGAAPARAPQSPAKAGVNSKEQNGAEARAEAENQEEVIWDAVVNEDYRRNSEEIHQKYSQKKD